MAFTEKKYLPYPRSDLGLDYLIFAYLRCICRGIFDCACSSCMRFLTLQQMSYVLLVLLVAGIYPRGH